MRNRYTGGIAPKRILIVKISSLGDIVQAIPVVFALKEHFPGAETSWVAGDKYADILRLIPEIKEVIPFHRRRWGNPFRFTEFIKFIKRIKAHSFDIVIDLQGLFRSGVIGYLARIPARIGFANARELAHIFYNHKVEVPSDRRNAKDRYMTLVEYLGCSTSEVARRDSCEVEQSSSVHRPINSLGGVKGGGAKGYILINPGGRWETKKWPAEKYSKLINLLAEKYGREIILIGDQNDISVSEEIKKHAKTKVTDLTGQTDLVSLVELIKSADLLITNDSGPMHLGDLLGVPLVAVFGPTDASLTGPSGKGSRVISGNISCRPCFRRRCGDIKCMGGVGVEEVFAAAEDIISHRRNNG